MRAVRVEVLRLSLDLEDFVYRLGSRRTQRSLTRAEHSHCDRLGAFKRGRDWRRRLCLRISVLATGLSSLLLRQPQQAGVVPPLIGDCQRLSASQGHVDELRGGRCPLGSVTPRAELFGRLSPDRGLTCDHLRVFLHLRLDDHDLRLLHGIFAHGLEEAMVGLILLKVGLEADLVQLQRLLLAQSGGS